MKLPVIPVFLTIALVLCGTSVKSDSSPTLDVKKLMTAEEYDAAGIDKLSKEERAALNRWLLRYTANEAPTVRAQNPEVRKIEAETSITARIEQPFKGWTGKTVFKLDNGQVWKQRLSGKYRYRGDDTQVVIKKNALGFYKMTLTATDKTIGVKRIK